MAAAPNHPSQRNDVMEPMNCVITSEAYPYEVLNQEIEEIRLVTVERTMDASQPLRCQLKHESLHKLPLSKISYKALSYMWGPEEPCKSIILDGFTVPVRENLHDALSRLRRDTDDESLVLWVDAICINQKSNVEKSNQISKMGLIFETATMVVVWLGPERSRSSLAFKLVRDLTSCSAENLSALIRGPARFDEIKALRELYYRDYWWRIWVVQEVVVAKNAMIYCGDEYLPWDILYGVGGILTKVADDLSKMMYQNPDWVFKLISSGPRSLKLPKKLTHSTHDQDRLLDLLRSHKSKYSSDPRDKVYGLIGISDARDNFTIDYSWPVQAVYVYTAQYIIKKKHSLDVICVKNHDRNDFGLPSWVPDWTRNDAHTEHRVMGLHIRNRDFRAGADTPAAPPAAVLQPLQEPPPSGFSRRHGRASAHGGGGGVDQVCRRGRD